MRVRPVLTLVLACCATVAAVTSLPAQAASKGAKPAPRTWAPVATAKVTPGVQTLTDGGQCTANFVFTDATNVYIGQAAHCSGTGSATDTNGCSTSSLPLGTPVTVAGFKGTLVYNSWLAMKAAGEKSANACDYNDFALIKLPAAAIAVTNPSVPVYGGPVALGTGAAFGQNVYSYGNSSLRFGLRNTSPKRGVSLGDAAGGWTTDVYTVTPGIPGDSGSGFLDRNGNAFGTLSTVALFPLAGSNGVSNLALELAYAKSHGFPGLALVPGTQAFNPSALS